MGVSTDGILCFGIDLGEDIEDYAELARIFEEFDGDAEDYFASLAGVPEYGAPDFPGYKERDRRIAALPISLVRHCSGEYPMHILTIPGTEITARRGDPVCVYTAQLQVEPERVTAFLAWCAEHDIDVPEQGPQWILCSMWW
jgi:hypothetical protein